MKITRKQVLFLGHELIIKPYDLNAIGHVQLVVKPKAKVFNQHCLIQINVEQVFFFPTHCDIYM